MSVLNDYNENEAKKTIRSPSGFVNSLTFLCSSQGFG